MTETITKQQYMLSTVDNPYNPFDDFIQWFMFDTEKGYNSCSRLDRIAKYTDDMTQKEVDEETERAIDEIIKYDFMDVYIKVSKNTSETT
jgi:hypothetical protein